MKAVQEQTPTLAPILEMSESEQPQHTKRELINALFSLANNNPLYRRGKIDQVGFHIDEVNKVEDIDKPGIVNSVTYKFLAHRQRSPGERPSTRFDFSVVDRQANLSLPYYLAEESYGIPAEEAIEEAGKVMHTAELSFDISTDDRYLAVSETYSWIDQEGDIVSEVSSDVDPFDEEVLYFPTDSEAGETEGAAKQYATGSFASRMVSEPVSFPDTAEAIEFWRNCDALETMLTDEDGTENKNIAMAYSVLSRIRRALLVQAGVEV